MDERKPHYLNQLEELGFYVDGRPGAGTLDANALREARKSQVDVQHIDRSFKYGSVLDKAKLGVTDVYELDGSPCIYFKSVGSEPSEEQIAQWHKAAWNHGLARMLWLCTPTQIRVFNAFAPPPEDLTGLKSPDVLLFESVADQLEALKSHLLTRERIESGEFWFGPIGKRINRETRIDEQLVEDLTLAAGRLVELGLDGIQAHRLLLRTVFIAYLEAKGILPGELFDGLGVDTFEDVLSSVSKTEKFFTRMTQTFNGDLFPPPPRDATLARQLTTERLRIPQCILARTDLTTLQRSFKFWRYDFSVIPIELISSIYERFIHAGDPEKARQAGTHYTPVSLVDFVLSQVFDDGLFQRRLPAEARVLDLSCGSGVFLVESLRRIIARRLAAGEKHTRRLVRDALYNQVYGVDIEETAVEIAAFSLCLTAFELDPVPNSPHQLKFKQELKGRTLFVDDAFDSEAIFQRAASFKNRQFDVVVGNPPWTRAKGPRSVRPSRKQLYIEYSRKRKPKPVTLPFRNPPDQAFVWRASDFARSRARFGFLLEGKRFFSTHPQSRQAKAELLTEFSPRMLVNLTALHRENLFPSAQQPAIALILENEAVSARDAFPFVVVERDRSYRGHGLMRLGPEDVKRLSASLAASHPYALKVASWGSARDMALVDRLTSDYATLEEVLAKHDMEMDQGYIVGNRAREVPAELHGLPCLTGGGMPPFEVTVDGLPEFEEERLEHPRDPDVYRGPLVLCASGLHGNRVIAALCREDLVYSRSQFGIPLRDGKLRFGCYLNAVLNSSLATYFAFLTATRWGVDKYAMEETDYLRIPVPALESAKDAVVESIVEIERQLRKKARSGRYDQALVGELDKAVFKLYGLDRFEQILVEDMVSHTIDLQRKHEKSKALSAATARECRDYAKHVIAVIQPFLETRKKRRLVADVLDMDAPLRVVRFRIMPNYRNGRPNVAIENAADLSDVLHEVVQNLDEQIAFGIHTRRHLRVYSGDSFYVVKPSQRRFWTRAAGLTDGDSVLKDLLARGGGE
ncbi:MAG: HsdM family class I SAM-dependent methyltransferase [Planctomycetota bacterium]|jgi:hypothetical protein